MGYGFKVMMGGDYALFSRPEMKVERVSYDVPTPGALEGMFKSIYWKPAIRYVIDKIIVFNPIRFVNIRRNEVKDKLKKNLVKQQMKGGEPTFIYTSEVRSQRSSMILKDVCYGVEFHFELTGLRSEHENENKEKHYNIISKRLKKGQCFKQPVFEVREFPVKYIELVDEFPIEKISDELNGDIDMGYMLYHMRFKDKGIPKNGKWMKSNFSDEADPVFYRPHMINGIIDVEKYKEELTC